MKARLNRTLKNLSTHVFSNKEFFLEVGKALGKGAGTIGLLYLASKLDLPITVSPGGEISTKKSYKDPLADLNLNIPSIIFSRNSQDSAIATFADLGKAADWDTNKLDFVKKIFSIAKDCTDENTRMLAISSINQITGTMDWDSYKRYATDYILELAKQKIES